MNRKDSPFSTEYILLTKRWSCPLTFVAPRRLLSTMAGPRFLLFLEKDREDTKLLRLGINGTTITLRAVTHKAAMYWVDGLQRLRDGKPLQIVSDPPCTESEDEIFDEIDKILSLRECTPPPPPPPLCGLCISTSKPEPSTAGTLLKSKKNTQDEGVSSGCKIC
ncbi:hypothetical protein PInf_005138 [Phytophthora infestans]|nr:hypothetical protein PInf_005138 [Phytophthora infestans]